MVTDTHPAAAIETAIAVAYKELVTREHAAAHLSGIPARHNQQAIDGLYDELNHLHLRRIGATWIDMSDALERLRISLCTGNSALTKAMTLLRRRNDDHTI